MSLDKESWYRKRNDRIDRMIGTHLKEIPGKPIGVIIGADEIHCYSNQIMTLLFLNMMARWCPYIVIEMPKDVNCLIPNYNENTLNDLLRKVTQKADPYGKFIFEKVSLKKIGHLIYVGKSDGHENAFWIDAEGWIAGYGFGKPKTILKTRAQINPIGPSMAACLGVAALFKAYLELNTTKSFSKWYSLYNFSSSNEPVTLENPSIKDSFDIGRIYQVGCGAVGSSLDFLLSLVNVKGILHLIDFDTIKISNIASSLVFNSKDAKGEIKKIEACNWVLQNNQLLKTISYDGAYENYIKNCNYENEYPDQILCLANERNVWSSIQNNQPPTVLHATTTKNWGINFGRHIPEIEWCIVCRFGIQDYQFIPHCAEAIIKEKEEEQILGTLPFLSPLAAILIFAEMIKFRFFNQYPINMNFIQFSTKIEGCDFIKMQVGPFKRCIVCGNRISF